MRDQATLSAAYRAILAQVVTIDLGTMDTPDRAAKALLEMTSGYEVDVPGLFTTFDSEGYDQMIAVTDVPFVSLCEHHMLPFTGFAHVVYVPNGSVVGLSKIPRLVQAYAKRLQIQERMTAQIADALNDNLHPVGVLVRVEAKHMCMFCRGVRSDGLMKTTALRGSMYDGPGRDEALRMIE